MTLDDVYNVLVLLNNNAGSLVVLLEAGFLAVMFGFGFLAGLWT